MDDIKANAAEHHEQALTDSCQEPLASCADREWWAPMVEVFHTD